HARRGFQAESSPSRHDSVHFVRYMAGIERRDLLGAGRGAANVHSALLAENRRAARDRAVVGDVSDPDSGNVYKSFHPFDLRFYGSIGVRGPRRLLDPLKGFVASVNDFFVLTGRAIRSIFPLPPLLRRYLYADGRHRRRQPDDRRHDRLLRRRGDASISIRPPTSPSPSACLLAAGAR